MKSFVTIILALILSISASGQASAPLPISQAEYVKMLYALERDPSLIDSMIQDLRTRGIDFDLTDGIRSLTSSKSRSDRELRRTLEEAARRRTSPISATPPSAKQFLEIVSKARSAAKEAIEEMPDFVVKQQIERSIAYFGTTNFKSLDRIVVGVSYRANGGEEYRVLSVNGVRQNDAQGKASYEEVGGSSSTGEFVTVLSKIFNQESQTKFDAVDTDLIRGRQAVVASFSITKELGQQALISSGTTSASAITGMDGKIWIDTENFRVLRIESNATEIPIDFPIRSARRTIDYDWVRIADQTSLLPSISDVRLVVREGRETYETRNLIRFKDYQKYGSEIKILDDDVTPSTDAKKP